MKHLLPLILLCLLLCGCAQTTPPEETAPPTESVVAETSRPEEYGGALHKIPLNLRKVHGLHSWDGDLLLLSGYGSTTLTLLQEDSLEVLASVTLDAVPEEDTIRFHPDGTFSFQETNTGDTLVLDRSLTEIRRIPRPGGCIGAPVLSGNTLFYCTATHVRAWDLESGIRRIVKEMSFDSQSVTEVLMDGTVVQCAVTEDGRESSLFLSAQTGQQLHRMDGACRILTEGDRYYGVLTPGFQSLCVYGSIGAEPFLLTPENPDGSCIFLPETELLLTCAFGEDDRVQLCRYDLDSGFPAGTVTLEPFLHPLGTACGQDGLYLLVYDPAEDRNYLLFWEDTSADAASDSYSTPYWNRDLSGLRQEAQDLGQQYGIQILIGPEAAEASPWDYTLTPEELPAVLQRELAHLEQRLSHYPAALLKQTADHFSGLSLCLVRKASGRENTLLTTGIQFLDNGHAYIAISVGRFSEQALYHELFHLMETHIFGNSKAFDRWNELNPAGFQYDYDYAANALRDSGVYLFEDHRAFVDTYSMSFPKEDRARIMEYAMLPEQKDLFRTEIMQRKLRTLCTGIREAYGLEDAEEHFLWEQYLE